MHELTLIAPFAHVGHWAVWVLYAVPIIAVLLTIWLNARSERKKREAIEGEPAEEAPVADGQAKLSE